MNKAFYIRETFLGIKRYKLMSLKMFALCFVCAFMMTFTFSFGMSLKNDMDEIIDKKCPCARIQLWLMKTRQRKLQKV